MEEPPKKRVRVSLACQECRHRKTRCDGNHPVCKRCEQLGLACSYDQPTVAGTERRPDTFRLLCRVQELESQLKSFAKSRTPASTDAARSESITSLENCHSSSSPRSTEMRQDNAAHDQQHKTDDVDGMGVITLSNNETFSSYFGASSNIALVFELSRVLKTLSDTQASSSNLSPTGLTASENYQTPPASRLYLETHGILAAGAQNLPSEPQATSLLHEYFDTLGLFFPCIHRDVFLAKYREFRRNDSARTTCSKSWLALLFMIFAVMYQMRNFASPTDVEKALSQNYFQRGLDLAMPEAVTESNLEIVQLLCLMTCYLQSSTNSAQTWSFHVLAVKAAMQIGLHSFEASKSLPLLERELRKRTWFWCVVNDALVSVYLGRPPVVPKSLVSNDLPDDISDIFPISSQSRMVVMTSLTYYNATIRLAVIISDILAKLYSDNLASTNDMSVFETIHLTFDLSWKLSEWRNSIPIEIRPPESTAAVPTTPRPLHMQRFQTGLSLHFYGAQTLICRPLLLKFLQFESDDVNAAETLSLLRDSGFPNIKKCMYTCSRAIALAKTIVDEQFVRTSLWGAWWMTNFLVFNASMMQFGILLIKTQSSFASLVATEDIDRIRSDLRDASQVHHRLNSSNPIVARCRECLHRFLELYNSFESTTAPNEIETWEDLALLLHPAGFRTVTEAQIQEKSVFENIEHDFGWGDVNTIPDSRVGEMARDLPFSD